MNLKRLFVFTLICFSFDLLAQLPLNQKAAFVIESTQHDNGNLWWGEKIPTDKLEALKEYIAQGADPRVRTKDGISPIHYAAAAGDLELIKYLVNERHVDINAANRKGVTPLMVAAMFGQTDALKLLRELGANIDARDQKYRTALHWAVTAEAQTSIALLCSLGANVNALASDGSTPMNYASWMKYSQNEAAYLLMSHGGRLTGPVRWWDGWSQLLPITNTAQIMRDVRIELRSRTPDLFLPLRISSDIIGARGLLRRFLAYPAYRNRDIYQFRNKFGNSLLFSAVYFRNIPCALLLLENGANPLNREHSGTSNSLALANRVPEFHQLNLLTGQSYFQDMLRAATWHLYLPLAPLARPGSPLFLAPDTLRYIAYMMVSLHLRSVV